MSVEVSQKDVQEQPVASDRPHFWEAPAGAFESAQEYERFRADVFDEVLPKGPLEGVLVNDVALLIWDAACLRRIRRNILGMAFPEAAEIMLNECFSVIIKRDPEVRSDNAQLADNLRYGDDDEKRRALAELQEAGITRDQVEARAYLLRMSEIDAIDRKIIQIDKRREANLRTIRETRSFLLVKLREIAGRTNAMAAS